MQQIKTNPFGELASAIDDYTEGRFTFDLKHLQDIRDRIALCLFYLSSDTAAAIAKYDMKDWERKRNFAQLSLDNRFDENGVKNTVQAIESIARIKNKEFEESTAEALRQKSRAKIILSSANQVLNAIASRMAYLNKTNV